MAYFPSFPLSLGTSWTKPILVNRSSGHPRNVNGPVRCVSALCWKQNGTRSNRHSNRFATPLIRASEMKRNYNLNIWIENRWLVVWSLHARWPVVPCWSVSNFAKYIRDDRYSLSTMNFNYFFDYFRTYWFSVFFIRKPLVSDSFFAFFPARSSVWARTKMDRCVILTWFIQSDNIFRLFFLNAIIVYVFLFCS